MASRYRENIITSGEYAQQAVASGSRTTRSFLSHVAADVRDIAGAAVGVKTSVQVANAVDAAEEQLRRAPRITKVSRANAKAGPSRTITFSAPKKVKRKVAQMPAASAMAAGAVLLGKENFTGETTAETLAMARESLSGSIVRTSVPPATRLYRQLTEALGVPLRYVPSVAGHDAAATARRAWVSKMEDSTAYGQVGMVAPSSVEWHLNPDGVAYYHDVEAGVDPARINRPCAECGTKRCQLYLIARKDGRVADDLASAAKLFSRASVDYLWLVNVEPNMPAGDILTLMLSAKIENGFSCAHVDWAVLTNGDSKCMLTSQVTKQIGDKVVSSFADCGAYTQRLEDVKAMFAPTFGTRGCLRRTVLGRFGTSMLMELQVEHGGVARVFVPNRDSQYLLAVPHPTRGRYFLSVEREGFDRVLAQWRTAADKSVVGARTMLRQANVTYSVAGTSLTPRMKVSATESELIAIWMMNYSAMCDAFASGALETFEVSQRLAGVELSKRGLFTAAVNTLSNGGEQVVGFGTPGDVKRWSSLMCKDGRMRTLDEISASAMEEVYGAEYSVDLVVNKLMTSWDRFAKAMPSVDRVKKILSDFVLSFWQKCFKASDVLAKFMIISGACSWEAMGLVFDTCIHICRLLRIPTKTLVRTQAYLDAVRCPVGAIWQGVQQAQNMTFQPAAVHVVHTLVNAFSPDPTMVQKILEEVERDGVVRAQTLAELRVLTEEETRQRTLREVKLNLYDVPFSRILCELKMYMERYNTRVQRMMALEKIMDEASEQNDVVPEKVLQTLQERRAEVQEVIMQLPESVETSSSHTRSVFALTGNIPGGKPVPMPSHTAWDPITGVEIGGRSLDRIFDEKLVVSFTTTHPTNATVIGKVRRLDVTADGRLDFKPILEQMQGESADFMVTTDQPGALPLPVKGESFVYSPTAEGANLIKNKIMRLAAGVMSGEVLAERGLDMASLETAIDEAVNATTCIAPVKRLLNRARARTHMNPKPHLLHIEGLAMGGKSKGLRGLLTSEDIIIVSSNKLKSEWEKELMELDPFLRPSVFTQHTALSQRCARFVVVDEAPTFSRMLLDLYRRTPDSLGLITLGDHRQIRDIFTEGQAPYDFKEAHCVALAPCSFVPFDALMAYLGVTGTPFLPDVYYSGTSIRNGLYYQVADEIVNVGSEDLCINMKQDSKAVMIARGNKEAITAHESQGSRGEQGFIHAIEGNGMCPDLLQFSMAQFHAHFGVAITRCRQRTTFIVPDLATARIIPCSDQREINGSSGSPTALPKDFIFGNARYCLIEPVVTSEVTIDHVLEEAPTLQGVRMHSNESNESFGSMIDTTMSEAVPVESIVSDVDVSAASVVQADQIAKEVPATETFLFNPAVVKGSGPINMLKRRTVPKPYLDKDVKAADKIIDEIFNKFIDRKRFFEMLDFDRASIRSQAREQVIKMETGDTMRRIDSDGGMFPKNEAAKKLMEVGGDMKTLPVVAMSATQLMMFTDVADRLTHAWVRAAKPSYISPVGLTQNEVAGVLGRLGTTWELDLVQQDSTHTPTDVIVLSKLIEMCAQRLGMRDLVLEIRQKRRVRDLAGTLKLVMGSGLGSGDQWTLIANKIMAISSVICDFVVPWDFKMLQTGDDITVNRKFKPRANSWHGSEGVKYTITSSSAFTGRPSFISNVSVNEDVQIAKRLRGLIKMCESPRRKAEHVSYRIEFNALMSKIAVFGLETYAEIHQFLFKSEADVVENIIGRLERTVMTDYDNLPDHLKRGSSDDVGVLVRERKWGCFGWALAHVVETNVQAVNALAAYSRPVSNAEAVEACVSNKVKFWEVKEKYQARGIGPQVDRFLAEGMTQGIIVLFDDHAVCLTNISDFIGRTNSGKRYRVDLAGNEVMGLDLEY